MMTYINCGGHVCRICSAAYTSETEAMVCEGTHTRAVTGGLAGKLAKENVEGVRLRAIDPNESETKALTGGSSSYYRCYVAKPTSGGAPYWPECNDIIEALQMTFAEGEAFKAVWRHAIVRQGKGKPGSTVKYEAEKVEFFGKRMVAMAGDA